MFMLFMEELLVLLLVQLPREDDSEGNEFDDDLDEVRLELGFGRTLPITNAKIKLYFNIIVINHPRQSIFTNSV